MGAGASAAYRHTLGRKLFTAQRLRDLTGDHVGGNTLDQLRAALVRAGVPGFSIPYRGIPTSTLYAWVRAGRGVVVQGSSIATRGTKWQASETFIGNHAWYVFRAVGPFDSAGRPSFVDVMDPLADGRRKGIAKSPLRIPRNLFEKFLAYLSFGGYERLGYGRAYALFTGVTIPHRHATSGGVYVRGRFKVKGGYNLRRSPGGKLIRKTKPGEIFDGWQKLSTGPNMGGSRTWYGDHSGTVWIHVSAKV
jgi:hypothetical protein